MLSDIPQKIPLEPVEVRGVVLATFPYSDKHLIVRLLVEQFGKVSALASNARGSKKRFTSIDLFERGVFRLARGRGSLVQIQRFEPERPFERLRTDLSALTISSLLAEVTDHLCPEEGEEDGHFFEQFSALLEEIAMAPTPKDMLRICFDGIVTRLAEAGFLDPQHIGPASRNELLRLLNHVESVTERGLKTRSAVEEEMKRLGPTPR